MKKIEFIIRLCWEYNFLRTYNQVTRRFLIEEWEKSHWYRSFEFQFHKNTLTQDFSMFPDIFGISVTTINQGKDSYYRLSAPPIVDVRPPILVFYVVMKTISMYITVKLQDNQRVKMSLLTPELFNIFAPEMKLVSIYQSM